MIIGEGVLNEIITSLNNKSFVSTIKISDLQDFDLNEGEKDFIKKYQPENTLIIYGTLAPNKPNHSKIEHIKGEWKKATVKGKLENKGWGAALGFYGFTHTSAEQQVMIEAYVLLSKELLANWKYLDDFEGKGYKRILAKYELENGEIGVGYIYAINENIN